jgi:hypothetical protein
VWKEFGQNALKALVLIELKLNGLQYQGLDDVDLAVEFNKMWSANVTVDDIK